MWSTRQCVWSTGQYCLLAEVMAGLVTRWQEAFDWDDLKISCHRLLNCSSSSLARFLLQGNICSLCRISIEWLSWKKTLLLAFSQDIILISWCEDPGSEVLWPFLNWMRLMGISFSVEHHKAVPLLMYVLSEQKNNSKRRLNHKVRTQNQMMPDIKWVRSDQKGMKWIQTCLMLRVPQIKCPLMPGYTRGDSWQHPYLYVYIYIEFFIPILIHQFLLCTINTCMFLSMCAAGEANQLEEAIIRANRPRPESQV